MTKNWRELLVKSLISDTKLKMKHKEEGWTDNEILFITCISDCQGIVAFIDTMRSSDEANVSGIRSDKSLDVISNLAMRLSVQLSATLDKMLGDLPMSEGLFDEMAETLGLTRQEASDIMDTF